MRYLYPTSFEAVQKAYKVFNTLRKEYGSPQEIPSFPEDVGRMSSDEQKRIRPNRVYGWDKKYDDGWENLFFIVF